MNDIKEIISEVQKIKHDSGMRERLEHNLSPFVLAILLSSEDRPAFEYERACSELVEFIRNEKIISAERAIRFYKKGQQS